MTNLELFDNGDTRPSNHTIFLENDDQITNFKAENYFETEKNIMDNPSNRLKKGQLKQVTVLNTFK